MTRTLLGRHLIIFVAACATLGVCSKTQAQTTLKWTAKAGDKLKYAFNQTTEITYVAQGQSVSNKSELNIDLLWTIKAIAADGTLDVIQVAERARVRITSAGRILDFDTANKDTSTSLEVAAFAKIYNAILNQAYTLKISPQGEFLDVKVPDVVVGAAGGTPFAATADTGSFLSGPGVKNMFAQLIPTLPKNAVNPSTTWSNELSLPAGPFSIQLKNDLKIESLTPALATIRNKITTSLVQQPKGDNQVQVKLKAQSGSGKVLFDPSGGHLIEALINQSMDLVINAGGADIPQTSVITSSLKLVK